jgi:ribosomal protein S12 methylthiotransferase
LWRSFCAIPGFRGKFRSKPWASLLEEIKYMAESGVKEFNLIAEDTNQYGTDRRDDKNLATLLREMGKIEGVEWIRILYAYPSYFTDDLIQAIAEVPQVISPLAAQFHH